MRNNGPKISIITATFNSEMYLEQTIESVLQQSYSNIEYIIVDAGSTDGTHNIVEKYRNSIDIFILEPDKGNYDAYNKGITASSGDVLYILNSDDYLIDNGILQEVADIFILSPEIQLVYGNVLGLDETNQFNHIIGQKMSLDDFKKGLMCPHQGMFVCSKVFQELGLFNINYPIVSDFDFAIKCFKAYHAFTFYFNRVIAGYRLIGGSSTPNTQHVMMNTKRKVIKEHFQTEFSSGEWNQNQGLYKMWLEYLLLQNRGITFKLHAMGIKRVAVFGTMKTALYLLNDLKKENIEVVVLLDNNKNMQNQLLGDIYICDPTWLLNDHLQIDAILISIESDRDLEVKAQIKSLIPDEEMRIISWKELVAGM